MTWIRVLTFALALVTTGAAAQTPAVAPNIDGLWAARMRYGLDVRGPLLIERREGRLVAEIAGRQMQAREVSGEVLLELPNGAGSFRGRFTRRGAAIVGHWIQPRTMAAGMAFASPVTLSRLRANAWQGEVAPLDDAMTMFLLINTDETGVMRAYLRNPERNVGVFQRIDRIERNGNQLTMVGRFRGRGEEQVFARAEYDHNNDLIPFHFPQFGVTMDFAQASPEDERVFYPRGASPASYVYTPPPSLDDGWRTGALEEVGIDAAQVGALIERIAQEPQTDLAAPQVHALLIARHGRLVLEEYFHGVGRHTAHDTRSASKSMGAVLAGAAMRNGAAFSPESRVVESVDAPLLPSSIDPRLAAMRVEHLLTMSPGFDCDDDDDTSPGNEDAMQEQRREPNWWRFGLAVPMARDPGERAVYCSMNPMLAGAVVSHATGRWLPDVFAEQVAAPLDIDRYYLNLTPTGDWYLGGGARFELRDFMKMGQLVLDGGVWNGRRVLDRAYVERMTASLVELQQRGYGYYWWSQNLPYRGGDVRVVYAAGNGGQIVMAVPELDLVIAFYSGDYGHAAALTAQRVYIPEYILPAVIR
ncbi:MAG: serine hydrolase domain-containing protein [Hyphomonadaceae bacterium]